jgi:SPX domain protein involved in polyphosphate accumulation
LVLSYQEHYRACELLKKFKDLNLTGFKKIIKKFEKYANEPYNKTFIKNIKKKRIFTSQILEHMIAQTQYFVINDLFEGNKKKGLTSVNNFVKKIVKKDKRRAGKV